MGPGFLVAAVGMLLLTQLDARLLATPALDPARLCILLGLGMGTAFMPAMSLATHGVEPRDAGVASAMVNTSQQVGGAIGTALLNTIAASATTAYVASHARHGAVGPEAAKLQALVHGYTTAIWWAVGILVLAAAIAFTFVNAGRHGRDAGRPRAPVRATGAVDELSVPVMAH